MWEFSFAWQGAVIGFCLFQANMGDILARNIYKAFFEPDNLPAPDDCTAEGVGHVLNYLIQAAIVTVGEGYVFGTVEQSPSGIMHPLTSDQL